jgi:hypothetical protein
MIEPGELYRYFKVREIRNGRDVWLTGDTRYEVIEDARSTLWNYRPSPDGDHFLARSAVHAHPWGRPMRLNEVEPLPGRQGLYHPDHSASAKALTLAMTYEGSFRQYADSQNETSEEAPP